MKIVLTLVFVLGFAIGALATLTYMHGAIKRQAALQTEVLDRAGQAKELTRECRSALEDLWDKIEAGRQAEMSNERTKP